MHTVSFNVDDVKVGDLDLAKFSTPIKDILKQRFKKSSFHYGDKKPLENQMYLEASSTGVGCQVMSNGFLSACTFAYANHIALELWVDHVKLVILQGFAIHIKENAEKFREQFVHHQDKKNLSVRRDDFILGQENPWTEVFGQFVDKVNNDIKDDVLIGLIQEPSQTTTPTTMAAINVAVLDAFSKYYNYTLSTMCGIPNITLKGSVEDWIKLKELVHYLGKYDFTWYTDKMEEILDEFIAAAKGEAHIAFWQAFVKRSGGSGGPYYSGHIKYFFAYLGDGTYQRNEFDVITSNSVPSGLSTVPFKWNYYNDTYEMKFIAGFSSLNINNGAVYPDVAWVIENVTLSEINYDIPQAFIDCYKYGKVYEPTSLRYKDTHPNSTHVICDFCRKNVYDKCIGYGENNDLCFTCRDIIKKVLECKKC